MVLDVEQEIGGAGAHRGNGLCDRIALRDNYDGKVGPVLAKGGDAGGAALLLPIGQKRGLDLAAMRALEQAHGGFDAVRADGDPARPRRYRGYETSLGRIGFNKQEGFGFLLAHRSSSASPTEKE